VASFIHQETFIKSIVLPVMKSVCRSSGRAIL